MSQKVYIVLESDYDDTVIKGVYSSLMAAEEVIAYENANKSKNYGIFSGLHWSWEEWEVKDE